MAVREEVVAAAPPGAPDTEARADLATSHLKIASTLQARGDSAGALAEYRACEALRAELAIDEPENSSRALELVKARMQVADMQKRAGRDHRGRVDLRQGGPTLDGLLRKDPGNATWRRERGLVCRTGASLIDKGDAKNATQLLDLALANHTTLLAKDPANTNWMLDLSRIHFRLADANLWRGQLEPALAGYRDAKAIRLALLAKDPASPLWRRLVAWADAKIAGAHLAAGEVEAAAAEAETSRTTRGELLAASPDQAGCATSWPGRALIARIHARAGRGRRGHRRGRSRDRPRRASWSPTTRSTSSGRRPWPRR
jgi:tetratricopeptide (TPR) repeat protein